MMKRNIKNNGLTLTELVVTVSILLLLVGIGIPAVKKLFMSFESAGGVQTMISAAMANARAIAVTQQKYAGVRFQRDINGNQYIIFIIHDPNATSLANGFRALQGRKPTKLPVNTGVMDLYVRISPADAENPADRKLTQADLDDTNPANLRQNIGNKYVNDTMTFSIIFSPGGSLVIHEVRVGRKSGNDDVFNTQAKIFDATAPRGMFIQDDYPDWGLGQENSRNIFLIYDRKFFDASNAAQRWAYIQGMEKAFINPYTGQIVSGQ